MRIGNLEINWTRTRYPHVWHHPPAMATRLDDMTPEQLRRQLAYLQDAMIRSNAVFIPKTDPFKRVHTVFFDLFNVNGRK